MALVYVEFLNLEGNNIQNIIIHKALKMNEFINYASSLQTFLEI